MKKTSKKHRLVGWGDDGISEWRSPLADYYSLSIAIDYCEQVGVDFPIKKLISTLIKSGFNIKASRAYSITSTADIFETLLKPYFRVDYERWGGDSPGRSGEAVLVITKLSNILAGKISKENAFLSGSELGKGAPFKKAAL